MASTSTSAARKPRRSTTSVSATRTTAATEEVTQAEPPARGAKRSMVPVPMRFPFDLSTWPETEYVAPIAFLRSALFGIVPKGRRRSVEGLSLAHYGGFELRFTGEVLDQFDHDLWLVAVRLAREHGMGMNVHFSKRSILKALGWDTSGKSMTRLHGSFVRLVKATIEIQGKGSHYAGHLVDEVVFTKGPSGAADGDDQYYFRLSPKMATLFAPEQSALLNVQERQKIKAPLAKWLQGFIIASPFAFPILIAKLRQLSGSSESERYRFRSRITAALEELRDVGVIESFRLDRTSVYITQKSGTALPRNSRAAV